MQMLHPAAELVVKVTSVPHVVMSPQFARNYSLAYGLR
jgi:hypothetical protein